MPRRIKRAFRKSLVIIPLLALIYAGYMYISNKVKNDPNFYGDSITPVVSFIDDEISFIPVPPKEDIPFIYNHVEIIEKANCKISQFGRSPWLHPIKPKDAKWEERTFAALLKMNVDDKSARIAIEKFKVKDDYDWVWIGNDFLLSHEQGLVFKSHFDTTYAKKDNNYICRNTSSNFKNPHYAEPAKYVKIESNGQTYHLIEPYACNNISRVFPDPKYPHGLPPGMVPPYADKNNVNRKSYPCPTCVVPVPEPSSIVLMVFSLVFLLKRGVYEKLGN